MTPPAWVHTLAILSLATGVVSAAIIAVDILAGHRHKRLVMDVVWPITGLWAGVFGLYGYYYIGRASESVSGGETAYWKQVSSSACHCGAGCSLGDLVAETVTFFVPILLFGALSHTVSRIIGTFTVDYLLAFAFGIAFQFYTLRPARGLGVREALVEAVKADTLSLTSWQVGMYGWMLVSFFILFTPNLKESDFVVFWFMMQIAMVVGFTTAYPTNWWLIDHGIKGGM